MTTTVINEAQSHRRYHLNLVTPFDSTSKEASGQFWRGLMHKLIVVSHTACVSVVYPSLIFTLLCERESNPLEYVRERAERTFHINEVYLYKLNIPFCSNTFIRRTHSLSTSAATNTLSSDSLKSRNLFYHPVCVCV